MVDEFWLETVVPAPPEALTDDVGPSPEVVVVVAVCDSDVAVDVSGSVAVVALDVPGVPEVVAPESVAVVAFGPVSVSGEPEVEFSPVVAEAMPWPVVATAMPRPTATARPLARLARVGRFACLPRLAADMTCSRLPRVAVSWGPRAET